MACSLFELGGGDGGDGQHIVHGARAIALRVEGDVEEAQGAQSGGDAVKGFERESAGKVGAGDLDAGEVAMVTDANLGKAEGVESLFGLLDLAEVLACDWPTVLNS